MEIRTATKEDLSRIMELGEEFNHLMVYQKDRMMMEQYLDRILVAETYVGEQTVSDGYSGTLREVEIVGYYHYIVSSDPGFEEMLRCYRQFPEELIHGAIYGLPYPAHTIRDRFPELCVIMQGACHREVARLFYEHLMNLYPEIWVYCSIKSNKPETYKELGFTFDPKEQSTFFNVSKGDKSTYQLGRWKKGD